MARRCDVCGKGTMVGNNVPRKGLARRKGGGGQHIGHKTKKIFRPNIVKIQVRVGSSVKSMKVCTRCLRTGKVTKA